LRRRQRAWFRRLTPATGLRPFAALLRRSPLRLPVVGLRVGRRGLSGASLATAAAAAAFGSRGLFARLRGRLEGYGVRCLRLRSGSLEGRLLLGLTADAKPAQRKSPSCARAAAAPTRGARSVRGRL